MKNRYSLTFLLIIPVLLFISNACSTPEPPEIFEPDPITTICIDTNCSDYSSQQEAQAAFDADPECRNDLDRDGDKIACERFNYETANCSTTSNCGCSGKTKAECEQDPCCRWKVGKGCECS